MGRGAIAVLTGLCAAPLFGVLGFWLTATLSGPGSGPDGSIANAYLALFAGLLVGIGGGVVTAILVALFLPMRWRTYALIGDAVLVIAMLVGWQIAFAEPAPLEYGDARPLLETELRLPQSMGASSIGAITFIEGLLDTRHDDQIRQEGDFIILPWETTPYRVKEWAIQIIVDGHQNWIRFDLDLPKRPTQSTDWSPWLTATAGDEWDVVEDISLRYRFRLIPYGQ